MTHDNEKENNVERNEAWLRNISDDPIGPGVEMIKLRLRVERQEHWFGECVEDVVPEDLADRVKRRIWSVLREDDEQNSHLRRSAAKKRVASVVYRLLGAAAAIALVAIGSFQWLRSPAPADGFDYVTAFDAFAFDELSESIDDLSDDISSLELASNGSTWPTKSYDDLDDDYDLLDSLLKMEADDWS